eukprot:4544818-Amphidinium_carterae.5
MSNSLDASRRGRCPFYSMALKMSASDSNAPNGRHLSSVGHQLSGPALEASAGRNGQVSKDVLLNPPGCGLKLWLVVVVTPRSIYHCKDRVRLNKAGVARLDCKISIYVLAP